MLAAAIMDLIVLVVALRERRQGSRPKAHYKFVIFAWHQRSYSHYPARGIQWPGGSSTLK